MCLACRSLFTAGVRCFDLDFVATQEHDLIVSHPDRLQVGFVIASHVGGSPMPAGLLGAACLGLLEADHAQYGQASLLGPGTTCSLSGDTRCRCLQRAHTSLVNHAGYQDTSADLLIACLPVSCQDCLHHVGCMEDDLMPVPLPEMTSTCHSAGRLPRPQPCGQCTRQPAPPQHAAGPGSGGCS